MSADNNLSSNPESDFREEAGTLAARWSTRVDVPMDIRQRLYPAVFEAFSTDDYSSVGIRDLSRISGLSSATIYKYFESKESLLTTIYAELFPYIAEEMEKSFSAQASAKENLKSIFRKLFEIYELNNSIPIVFFITVPAKLWMKSGGWKAEEVWPIFKKVIQRGQQEGSIDPQLAIPTIIGFFYMYAQREIQIWYHADRKYKLADRVDIFYPYFWRTIYCPSFKDR